MRAGNSVHPIVAGTFPVPARIRRLREAHTPRIEGIAMTDNAVSPTQRAKAEVHELEGSHVIMISQPQAVADVILKALSAVSS
jgi:hypothetical protein